MMGFCVFDFSRGVSKSQVYGTSRACFVLAAQLFTSYRRDPDRLDTLFVVCVGVCAFVCARVRVRVCMCVCVFSIRLGYFDTGLL